MADGTSDRHTLSCDLELHVKKVSVKTMDRAKQLRELDLVSIWQMSNSSLPVKQERGDHSLPSLK